MRKEKVKAYFHTSVVSKRPAKSTNDDETRLGNFNKTTDRLCPEEPVVASFHSRVEYNSKYVDTFENDSRNDSSRRAPILPSLTLMSK
jgi:hypothetical protein